MPDERYSHADETLQGISEPSRAVGGSWLRRPSLAPPVQQSGRDGRHDSCGFQGARWEAGAAGIGVVCELNVGRRRRRKGEK
jgi:hypothetical protein